MPPAWISLTLSRHFSLSFIASGRSSGLHPVSSQSCCIYVRASRPAFARPYEEVNRSTSLMGSSLLLQQCTVCLVCLIWIVFMIGGRWPYSWCFVGCCLQDLFNIAHNRHFIKIYGKNENGSIFFTVCFCFDFGSFAQLWKYLHLNFKIFKILRFSLDNFWSHPLSSKTNIVLSGKVMF